MVKSLVNINEARQAIQILTSPDQMIEIRALEASQQASNPYRGTLSGYFNDIEKLLNAISSIKVAKGVYMTLQFCNPDLLERVQNKLRSLSKCTSDNDILRYVWLPIDSDPVRPSNVSSDEKEHQRALAHSCFIRDELRKRGWPEPILADSGNGSHLLYKIDLPVSDKDLVKRVLEGLAQQFNWPESDEEKAIDVDKTLHNPSRILKLYGTLACKGDDTPERPHRLSRLLDVPDKIEPVSRDLLEAIAIAPPVSRRVEHSTASSPTTTSSLDLAMWIERHHIETYGPESYEGGTKWVLKTCVWDSSHTDKSAVLIQFPGGALSARCLHNSCHGKDWKDFRIVFEPDAYTNNVTKRAGDAREEQRESVITRLLKMTEEIEYIKTPPGGYYARVSIHDHYEVVHLSEKFKQWLVYRYKSLYGTVPNAEALSTALSSAIAQAAYEGKQETISTRIGEKDGRIYLDLANDKWESVEISSDGWRVITSPPVSFRRTNGMLPLPYPQPGGDIEDLRQLINIEEEKDFILIVAWLIGAFHPRGPYALLNLNGEQGSAKSKTTCILRNLVDPHVAPTRTTPKEARDLAIAAQNNMIIALDNLSSIPQWFSDALCRLATGSGLTTRALYSDDHEIVFSTRRPVLVNGIEEGLIKQGDLLNRTMMVTLSPPDRYRTEEEIDTLFTALHPQILGVLLTAASTALSRKDSVRLEDPPRLADFARWVTAAEPVLGWKDGTFLETFRKNQEDATSIVVETSPIAQALLQFMRKREHWEGMTSELVEALKEDGFFAKNARSLSGKLKRIAPSLRSQGIDIKQLNRTSKGSHVSIGKRNSQSALTNAQDRLQEEKRHVATLYHDVANSVERMFATQEKDQLNRSPERVHIHANGKDVANVASVANFPPDREGNEEEKSAPSHQPNQTTLDELRSLYKQVTQLIPFKEKREIKWNGPDTSYMVASDQYLLWLKQCCTSGNSELMNAAKIEMLRLLRIFGEPYDRTTGDNETTER